MSPEVVPPNAVKITELDNLKDLEQQGKIVRFLTYQFQTKREYAPVLHTVIYCAPTNTISNLEELNRLADEFPQTHLDSRTNHALPFDENQTLIPEMHYFISEDDRRPEGPLQAAELYRANLMLHNVSVTLFPTSEIAQAVAAYQISTMYGKPWFRVSDYIPERPAADSSAIPEDELKIARYLHTTTSLGSQ